MTTSTVELVLDAQAQVGEGAIWHGPRQVLYWVDISAGYLHCHDPAANTHRKFNIGRMVGTVVPRRSGGVILALDNGFASFDLDTETLTPIADPESHLPGNRFNDGKCDPAGRLWAGTMGLNPTTPSGHLYCLHADLSVHHHLDTITISNGLAWSLDQQTMYFIDSPTQHVVAFDFDVAAGTLSNKRVVIEVPPAEGLPDGMTIDAQGKLWIALWGGHQVAQWDPVSGKRLRQILVPASQVASCAFGGPDLDVLYITTARIGLSEAALVNQPNAGGLFKIKPGVQGIPAYEFSG